MATRNQPAPGDEPRRRPTLSARLRALHAAKQQFLDEDLAPPVDEVLLRKLVRRELSPDDARLVYELIHAFRTWDEAHTRIIAEEFRKRPR